MVRDVRIQIGVQCLCETIIVTKTLRMSDSNLGINLTFFLNKSNDRVTLMIETNPVVTLKRWVNWKDASPAARHWAVGTHKINHYGKLNNMPRGHRPLEGSVRHCVAPEDKIVWLQWFSTGGSWSQKMGRRPFLIKSWPAAKNIAKCKWQHTISRIIQPRLTGKSCMGQHFWWSLHCVMHVSWHFDIDMTLAEAIIVF